MSASGLIERVQCSARSKSSGAQCKNLAIVGGTVCRIHGGAAPQVLKKASERIAALRDKGIVVLDRQLDRGEVDPSTVVRLVRDFTEVVETLEGRTGRRVEIVTVDLIDQEIRRLEAELAELERAEADR